MRAPRLLNKIYLWLHPLAESLKASEEERESSGWLIVFFCLTLILFFDTTVVLSGHGSISRLPSSSFIWILALASGTCLVLSRRWLRVLVRLISK